MNTYTNKVILLAGNLNQIDTAFVSRLLDAGAREVRVLGGNETSIQSLRDELLSKHPEATKRLRFFVGDLSDNAYMEEAVTGADFVLYMPSIPLPFDCEVAPAETTITFLETVTNVLHTSTDCGVQKTVVVSPARQEPLVAMPDMLAALMETVVVAEGRYLGKDSKTAIICAKLDSNLNELADYAFAHAANADLLVQNAGSTERKPCDNFDFKREDQ